MPSSSSFGLRLATSEDIPGIAKAMSRAFKHDAPFVDVFYPDHDTPEGQAAAARNIGAYWQGYKSNADLIVAIPEHSGGSDEIMGFALWTYMSSSMNLSPAELDSTPFAKSESDATFARQLWRSYIVPRRTAVLEASEIRNGDGIWVLEYLAVDPSHQRKGVGERLVGWGLDKAHADGTWAIVEATPAGQPAYKKYGFQTVIHSMQFEVDEQFDRRRLPELAFMRHDCK